MATAKVTKKTASKKKASKGKSKDLIVSVVHEIENLSKEKAYAMAEQLSEDVEFNYFRLGGVLSVIHTNGWYSDDGYENFKDFTESKYGVKYRKAVYLIAIYNGLIEADVPWTKVKDLGWTKLKELAHILKPENVEEWVDKAKQMTVLQLQEYIKQVQKKGDGKKGKKAAQDEAAKTSTMTFKLHADQKEVVEEAIEKAKTEAGTEFSSVALESVALDYIGGSKVPVKKALPKKFKEALKNYTLEEADLIAVLKLFTWESVVPAFEKVWPDIDIMLQVPEE